MHEERFRAQLGLLTRAQALAAGFSEQQIDRRLANGVWVRMAQGVYRHAAAPVTFEQRVLAACLSIPGARASHRTAGALHKLHDLRFGVVEVSAARSSAHLHGFSRIHRVSHLDPTDCAQLGPIPATSVARTIVDLAALLPEEQLWNALDLAVIRRQTTVAAVSASLARAELAPGRAGGRVLREALRAWTPGPLPASPAEMLIVRRLLARGYPPPERQVPIVVGGRCIATVDSGYPQWRVVWEYDSNEWHGRPRAVPRDVARANQVTAAGYVFLVATAPDLRRGADTPFFRALDAVVASRTT